MTRKRATNGTVTTFKTTRGLWRAKFSYLDPETGLPVRADMTRKSSSELQIAIKELQHRSEQGYVLRDSQQTLSYWIAEWKDTRLKHSDRKGSTKELYRNLATKHLAGSSLGQMPLKEIRPLHLTRFFSALSSASMSDSTRRNIYTAARALFEDAVSDGLIAKNPMLTVKRPRATRIEAKYLTSDQVSQVLGELEGSKHLLPIALIAVTGIRRGEALGLEWENIDFDKKVMRVRATLNRVDGKLVRTEPKTQNSRRDIALTEQALGMLKTQKLQQAQERLRRGGKWVPSSFVFTTESGGPVDGRNLLRSFQGACMRVGIEGMGIHGLRHFAATLLLDSQVPMLVVSRILGHSSLAITADIYGHVIEETARHAMESLGSKVSFGDNSP
jgi:integrase